MATHRHSNEQTYRFMTAIRADSDTADKTLEDLAIEYTAYLGFTVTVHHVRNACKTLQIPFKGQNRTKPAECCVSPTTVTCLAANLKAVMERLSMQTSFELDQLAKSK